MGPPGQLGWTVVGDDVVLRGRGFHTSLTAQVRPNGRVWGMVSALARRHDAFDEQDALVIESIANLLATAIDRKSAGDAFRSWEERFAAGFESSLLGTLLVGADGRLREVNRAFGEMLGYEAAELVGMSFLGITPAGDAAVNSLQFRGMLDLSENRLQTTKRFVHRRGHVVSVELNVVSIHPPDGGPRCFFVQAQDITERLRAVSALRDSENRFRLLFHGNPVPMYVYDLDSARMLDVNEAALAGYGYDRPAFLTLRLPDLMAPEDARRYEALLEAQREEDAAILHATGGWRHLCADGRVVDVEVHTHVLPGWGGRAILMVAYDVSARARAEQALRSSEQTFSQMFMGNPLPMWLYELDSGRFLEVNTAATERYGYSRAELMAMRVQDIRPAEDDARLDEHIAAVRSAGSAYSDSGLWTHHRRDGTTIEVNIYSHRVPYRGHDAALMIAYDLTARRQAEAALRESEERLRTLVVNAPVVIFALDPQGRLLSAEGRALSALGLRTSELVGRSAFGVYPDNPQVRSVLSRAIRGEEFSTIVEIGEISLEGSFRPLFDTDGRLREVIGVATDISERTCAEAALRERIAELRLADEERRRLLGHLVTAQEDERRRVANDVHDEALPTLAAAILLAGQLAEQLTRPDEAETLRSIDAALEATVHQLRHLIGGLRPPGLDHGRLVPAIREAARSTFSGDVEVTVTGELATEPRGAVRAVMYRIAQEALANCRNHAGATRVHVNLAEVDGGVRVTIRDDGTGFDAGDIAESPALGHLGMISMRERAELVGGRWHVESQPGSGTLVEYWIPTPASATPDAGAR